MAPPVKVLITGASGGLGRYVRQEFPKALVPTSAEMPVGNREAVLAYVRQHRPDIVVHLAACADVTGCEVDPRLAEVNVVGTANIVEACMEAKASLIYMSTDAAVNPTTVYAHSKVAGEMAVRAMGGGALIVRANFFTRYCNSKQSFAAYVLNSVRTGTRLLCYTNVYASPVFAGALARRIAQAAREGQHGLLNVRSTDRLDRATQARIILETYSLPTDSIEPCERPGGGSDDRLGGISVGFVRDHAAMMAQAEPL